MQKEELLIELYLMLLSNGVGNCNKHNLEFWDPTLDAIILYEKIKEEEDD